MGEARAKVWIAQLSLRGFERQFHLPAILALRPIIKAPWSDGARRSGWYYLAAIAALWKLLGDSRVKDGGVASLAR